MSSLFVSKAALLMAGAAVAAVGPMAAAAHAAPTAQGHSAVQSQAARQVTPNDNDPVLRGKYWTYDGCNSDGQQGVTRGSWDTYQCANGSVFWVLWTNR